MTIPKNVYEIFVYKATLVNMTVQNVEVILDSFEMDKICT